jgi:hypothetical protein
MTKPYYPYCSTMYAVGGCDIVGRSPSDVYVVLVVGPCHSAYACSTCNDALGNALFNYGIKDTLQQTVMERASEDVAQKSDDTATYIHVGVSGVFLSITYPF